ncbi:hypothetical protein 1 [Beihai barnacle virus 7]|uniref:Nucleoprotein n=1 Tax=Beihai barnacle virus 7 TaxID=1922365 RepID=A0A1L3KMM0_9RHAB|nr:hypothetical protein 1 [Beihai barnacle virus 7]APG78660.1 hypothetical protein 1 [Beihai barnacle virus 7]
MTTIKAFLSGQVEGLPASEQEPSNVECKDALTDRLKKVYNYRDDSHKALLAKAWRERNSDKARLVSRKLLLAAPLFYSPPGSETWVRTTAVKPDNASDLIEDVLEDTLKTDATTTPLTTLSQRVLKILDSSAGDSLVSQETILEYLPIYAIIPWRALVKSGGVTSSEWFSSATGAMTTAIKAADDRLRQADETVKNDMKTWFAQVDPTELLTNHLAEIMACALAHSERVPPFIAASIQSVWMYHGLGTYIFLREAARTLGLNSPELLRELCCPLLNNQIMALVKLMIDEQANNTPVFPYIKIINTNFHSGVSTKRCIPLMYVLRQIICPISPKTKQGEGIWGKMCGVPSLDVRIPLAQAAMRLRRKHILTVREGETSEVMQQILGEIRDTPLGYDDTSSEQEAVDPDDLGNPPA